MKGIIFAKTEGIDWFSTVFDNMNPYMLKIVNKPLLEYFLDFFYLNDIRDIRIVEDFPSMELKDFCGDGSKWGVNISFSLARPEDEIEQILKKNKKFYGSESVLCVEGFQFIHYEKSKKLKLKKTVSMGKINEGQSLCHICKKELPEGKNDIDLVETTRLDSVEKYFDVSMQVLKEGGEKYVLPGYTADNDVFIGQNVEIARSCDLSKPFSVGNNVRLEQLSVIGKNAVIGSNVIVSSQTTIENSIIYDGTFIGEDLDLSSKIVFKNRIVSPESGSIMPIVDEFVVSGVKKKRENSFFADAFFYLLALVFAVIYSVPFGVLCVLATIRKKFNTKEMVFFKDSQKNIIILRGCSLDKGCLIGRVWKRLSLDRYLMVIEVIKFNLRLVGNRPVENSFDGRKALEELSVYTPGVFYYSDTVAESGEKQSRAMTEHYYNGIRSFRDDLRIFVRAYINRLVG